MSKIVYLDQNKWIELAKAIKRPNEFVGLQPLILKISQAVRSGSLVLPLTSTNIYETQKKNDQEQRRDLAEVQAKLSRGLVVRGRQIRAITELRTVLADCCNLPRPSIEDQWFLSNNCLEAFSELSDIQSEHRISIEVADYMRKNPIECLFEYLANLPEDDRRTAVKKFTVGLQELRDLTTDRIFKNAGETPAMKRKIYGVLLLINDFDRIIRVADELGLAWRNADDIGSVNGRRIVNDVPVFYVEREIALRLEAQNRPIHENDFRDMQSFCAVIPYVDMVIGENQFVNLARQAGLHQKFQTVLATDISALNEFLTSTD